jgi:hypothetical protein
MMCALCGQRAGFNRQCFSCIETTLSQSDQQDAKRFRRHGYRSGSGATRSIDMRVHPLGLLSFIFLAAEPPRTATQALPGGGGQVKDRMTKLLF